MAKFGFFQTFNYRTRAINGRGFYSKIIFWATGRGLYSREASIQKIFFLVKVGSSYHFKNLRPTEVNKQIAVIYIVQRPLW